jgi:hypothetical protein
MGYQEVQDLGTNTVIQLGGTNKEGKKHPTTIEGYYLGARTIDDRKKKSGVTYIYVFQTKDGNVGVWGKTDLDGKMNAAIPGRMMLLTFTGMRETPNGDMYTYSVKFDKSNTIEVTAGDTSGIQKYEDAGDEDAMYAAEEETVEDEDGLTEQASAKATQEAVTRKAKVQALLNGKSKKV